MSLFPRLRLPGFTSAYERVCEYFACRKRPSKAAKRTRRLVIDRLEERQLLSVSSNPVTLTVATGYGSTMSGQSSATDNNGDTVVTWTATDEIYDSDKGTYVSDENVYAEYLTQNAQNSRWPRGRPHFP